MHSLQQQRQWQQQPKRCLLASTVEGSMTKTRSLPAMLSDYYIGAAPWLISRARTTTAVMKTENVIGTLEGPEKGTLAIKRKSRSTRSCNVLFGAAKQNHQNKLYAASAAKAAVACAAVIESPSDEDDVLLVQSVAKSKRTVRSPWSAPCLDSSATLASSPSLDSSPSLTSSSSPTLASSSHLSSSHSSHSSPSLVSFSASASPSFYIAAVLSAVTTSRLPGSSSSPSATLASPITPIATSQQSAHPTEQQLVHYPNNQQAQQPPAPSYPLSSCPSLSHNLHSRHASCPCPPKQSLRSENPTSTLPISEKSSAFPPHRRASPPNASSPIVLHRSKSIAVLASSPTSAVLNISPVECQSLSPSTASPADAVYLSPRKKRSSSLFSSLSSSKVKNHSAKSQHYQAPDYLTTFFAETSPRFTDTRQGARSHSLAARQDNRFRPSSEPTTPLADSNSASLIRSQPFGDSRRQHLYHSRRFSLEPNSRETSSTSPKFYSYSPKSPSVYQPIMVIRKAKQDEFDLVTKEQSKHGGTRSIRSTVNGGDWGEPSASGHATLGIEPNSPGSGLDPWMLVPGSGSSYNGNTTSAPLPLTPLAAREEQISKLPPLQLLDRNPDSDPVLELETAQQIRLELPRKLRNATKWNLVYSSDQHGISMTTLFYRCKGKGPMVLAIKDTRNGVFGAFVNEELKTHLSYYGTGECFLWNATTLATSPQLSTVPSPLPSPTPIRLSSSSPRSPTLQSPPLSPSASTNTTPTVGSTGGIASSGKREKKKKLVQFWKWTAKNNYMVLAEPGFIGFGGGDGKFGLWIHSDLERGHSERCATFDNEPLAAASRRPVHLGDHGKVGDASPTSRPGTVKLQSPSPKNDKGEFYCQTIEIWSIAL